MAESSECHRKWEPAPCRNGWKGASQRRIVGHGEVSSVDKGGGGATRALAKPVVIGNGFIGLETRT